MDKWCSNSFASWLATPAGQDLLDAERSALATIVDGVFGHHGLEITGADRPLGLLSNSAVVGRFAACLAEGEQIRGVMSARLGELPLQNDSLRLIVLHHVLEQVEESATLLREVERILAPEGVAVLIVLNRCSLWGLARRVPWLAAPPSRQPYIRVSSLARQLKTLGVAPVFERFVAYGLPRAMPRPAGRFQRLAARLWRRCGASCILVARKKREGMTPLKLSKAKVARRLPAAASGAGAWCEQADRRAAGER